MNFTQFNKTNRIDWGVKTENLPFKKLSELANENIEVVKIRGFYLCNTKFGKQANMIIDSAIVNVPKSMTDTIESILNDSEAINAIKNSECYARIRKYHSKTYNKDCYTFDFISESEVYTEN